MASSGELRQWVAVHSGTVHSLVARLWVGRGRSMKGGGSASSGVDSPTERERGWTGEAWGPE